MAWKDKVKHHQFMKKSNSELLTTLEEVFPIPEGFLEETAFINWLDEALKKDLLTLEEYHGIKADVNDSFSNQGGEK
jgi:surfactin synthase thioesterase subunit